MNIEDLHEEILAMANFKSTIRCFCKQEHYYLDGFIILSLLGYIVIYLYDSSYLALLFLIIPGLIIIFYLKTAKKISDQEVKEEYVNIITKKIADYPLLIEKINKLINEDWATYEEVKEKYQQDLKILFDSTQAKQKLSQKKLSKLKTENELLQQLKSKTKSN